MRRWTRAVIGGIGLTAFAWTACTLDDYRVGAPAGFSIASVDPSYVRLDVGDAGSSSVITVVIARDPGFDAEITLALANAPPNVSWDASTIAADASTGTIWIDVPSDAGGPEYADASVVASTNAALTHTRGVGIRVGGLLFQGTSTTCAVPTCTWTVPPDIDDAWVWLAGGGGGGGSGAAGNGTQAFCDPGSVVKLAPGGDGGNGGYVVTELRMTPGELLTVSVGRGGNPALVKDTFFGGGGGGGGYTSLSSGTTILAVAGGGGGGGGGDCAPSKPASDPGTAGGNGSGGNGTSGAGANAGTGASATSAGTSGTNCSADVQAKPLAGFLSGAGCVDDAGLSSVICFGGGKLGGGAGLVVKGANGMTGGGGGGGGYFGGGAGGGGSCPQGTNSPAFGGGGGSGFVDSGRVVGTPQLGSSANGGAGGIVTGVAGGDGFILVYLK